MLTVKFIHIFLLVIAYHGYQLVTWHHGSTFLKYCYDYVQSPIVNKASHTTVLTKSPIVNKASHTIPNINLGFHLTKSNSFLLNIRHQKIDLACFCAVTSVVISHWRQIHILAVLKWSCTIVRKWHNWPTNIEFQIDLPWHFQVQKNNSM